ncbi:mobilization protein [Staphylococcus lugdunensis]|uniref:mobilization protein n=1 Tax=Staphylococcus lugdunensis TaxID=28035 RepID=UPI000A109545|nr:mobilization protein [Staphylococcus lugdunensis]ARJ28149.1 mobilization protein [Staphylococcus lugdunensis]MCH8672932.1 mobilization protein [Staphylococcus lugdunensis]MCH8674272.1 mobilization protein [Staphylococcus lugdunensis]MCI2751606.1 mobilization protein [Staphylococcus lugdunensis]MCI2762187.1 mobilization protein [Staphylococcus lugdunensis]
MKISKESRERAQQTEIWFMSITKHNIKWINNADLKQGFQSAINDELDDIQAETKNAVNPFQNNQIYELD